MPQSKRFCGNVIQLCRLPGSRDNSNIYFMNTLIPGAVSNVMEVGDIAH